MLNIPKSVIERRIAVSKIFSSYEIIDVFSTMDFSDQKDGCTFIVVTRNEINIPNLWKDLMLWYPMDLHIERTNDYHDPILRKHKLVWRGGKWYV